MLMMQRALVLWESWESGGRAQWHGTYSLGYYPNAIIGHTCTPAERCLLALPVRMGGLGITNPCHIAASEYEASIAITERPFEQIVAHTQELPDDRAIVHCSNVSVERSICALQTTYRNWRIPFQSKLRELPTLLQRKGASNCLAVIPVKDVGF